MDSVIELVNLTFFIAQKCIRKKPDNSYHFTVEVFLTEKNEKLTKSSELAIKLITIFFSCMICGLILFVCVKVSKTHE